MDFKLDSTGDIAIENGDFVFVTDLEAIAQDIIMTLRTWLQECVYDRSKGVPYLQIIFQRGTTPQAAQEIIRQIILTVRGVREVLEIEATREDGSRLVTMSGRVLADTGEVPFSVEVVA